MSVEPLRDGEVHLWFLPRGKEPLDELAETGDKLLAPDERARMGRFRSPQSGRRFLLQRALLRQALAHHLGVDAADLTFTTAPHGKPRLTYPERPEVDFNLSHSGATAVVAVARANRVGIDLESLDRAPAALRIANRFFSKSEQQLLRGHGSIASARALALWSLKESVVKAVGKSLWDGLTDVEIAIEDGLLRWLAPPPEGEDADWALVLAQLRDTHLLTLAMRSAAIRRNGLAWRLHTLGPEPHSECDLVPLAASTATRRMPAPR